jgi:hypothetical protein
MSEDLNARLRRLDGQKVVAFTYGSADWDEKPFRVTGILRTEPNVPVAGHTRCWVGNEMVNPATAEAAPQPRAKGKQGRRQASPGTRMGPRSARRSRS